MGWVRARFQADEDDPRPVTVPPPGPWWCTGYGDGYSIAVAYLRPGQDVHTWWPEAANVDAQDVEGIVFTDRFPKPPEWVKAEERWATDDEVAPRWPAGEVPDHG